MNPDRLVLLALGEPVTDPVEARHVDQCATCQLDLDAMRTVADLGRRTQDLTDLCAPAERVWRGIVAGTGIDDGSLRLVASSTPPASAALSGKAARGAPVRPRRLTIGHRWRQWGWSLTIAVASAAVAVLATVWTIDRPSAGPNTAVAASAQLDALPIAVGSQGVARVLGEGSGDRLQVQVSGLPASDGFYEVWLIDPDSTRMVSIGLLREDGNALLPLPSTVDWGRYRLVDVSAEEYDGDVTHSGRSLLRGTLTG